eukprot:COSAG02_NODE_3087_length_7393_cov_5.564299_2_plen_166_part_00
MVVHQLHRKDKFLIIASDGLWDEVSSDQAVFAVGHFIEKYGRSSDASLASRLLEYCLSKIAARLAIEEPELGLDSVEGVRAMPAGKTDPVTGAVGRRGLMDDITILVLTFDEVPQNVAAEQQLSDSSILRSGRSRGRMSTQGFLETMDDVTAKIIEAQTPKSPDP